MDVSIVDAARLFFLAGASAGIILNSVPWLSSNFVSYGTRAQNSNIRRESQSKDNTRDGKDTKPSSGLVGLIRTGVPHSWFIHYYIFAVAGCVFWGLQLLSKGSAFQFVAQFGQSGPSMKPQQTMFVCLLLLIQTLRRLLETIAFTKPSASRMPWSIYGIGIAYYAVMPIAVWVEGIRSVAETDTIDLLLPVWPSLRTTLGVIIFALASGLQHDCHEYLASLKKYTLPEHPAFQYIVCPHYTAELVLYIGLAMIGAPPGQWINRTLLCNVIWVLVNLGLIADETKRWSENKFGRDKVSKRSRMIPGIW